MSEEMIHRHLVVADRRHDERFFDGSFSHLVIARRALDDAGLVVPLLAKEFVIDARQLEEAAACGADAALSGARENIARKTYIRAIGYNNPIFDRALAAPQADPSWHCHQLPCGHFVMVDMPDRLTELLLQAATWDARTAAAASPPSSRALCRNGP